MISVPPAFTNRLQGREGVRAESRRRRRHRLARAAPKSGAPNPFPYAMAHVTVDQSPEYSLGVPEPERVR